MEEIGGCILKVFKRLYNLTGVHGRSEYPPNYFCPIYGYGRTLCNTTSP